MSSFRDALKWLGRPIREVPTPCLVIDRSLLEFNLNRMRNELGSYGKRLRPHAKSHKCSHLAKLQMQYGAIGICVAKVSEAEALQKSGLDNILVTGPFVTREAFERVESLLHKAPELMVTFDSLEVARSLSRRLVSSGLSLDCLLDMDVGLGRTGVDAESCVNMAIELAGLPRMNLVGLQAYAGHAQHIMGWAERKMEINKGLQKAIKCFKEIQSRGIAMTTLSLGGTGSYEFDREFAEVTEIQAGSYALMDVEYEGLERAKIDSDSFRVSLTVHSTVVSANHQEYVTLDAGLKSLYRDGGRPGVLSPKDDLVYEWFGDEYGCLRYGTRFGGDRLSLGDRVRLVAPHCDPTVNLFDYFYVVDNECVSEIWPIDLRGCSQ